MQCVCKQLCMLVYLSLRIMVVALQYGLYLKIGAGKTKVHCCPQEWLGQIIETWTDLFMRLCLVALDCYNYFILSLIMMNLDLGGGWILNILLLYELSIVTATLLRIYFAYFVCSIFLFFYFLFFILWFFPIYYSSWDHILIYMIASYIWVSFHLCHREDILIYCFEALQCLKWLLWQIFIRLWFAVC